MNPNLKLFFFLIASTLSLLVTAQDGARTVGYDQYGSPIPVFSDTEIQARLAGMKSCLSPKFTPVVKSYIKTYTVTKRAKAERILGRSVVFFPMFEKYIREYGLPLDLKYLSVVESALEPNAVSRSKAVGLWQFMSPTAGDYNMKINSLIDERRDPHKSTQAAMKHLTRLIKRFGNWELALAAYNGGGGRVSSAIKRSRSKNFWRVARYLPKETRNYVPAFIAASYLMHYYHHHNLVPQYPNLERQTTETIKIYDRITFQRISELTGAPMHLIAELNPAYLRKFIPSNRRGNYLTLPQNAMVYFRSEMRMPDSGSSFEIISTPIPAPAQIRDAGSQYIKTYYTVGEGENITTVAKLFQCSPKDIQEWNRLAAPYIGAGQLLIMYQNKSAVIQEAENNIITKAKINTTPIPTLPIRPLDNKAETKRFSNSSINVQSVSGGEIKGKKQYIFYQIRRGETLADIADKYPNVSLRELIKLNNITANKTPKAGTRIRLKAF